MEPAAPERVTGAEWLEHRRAKAAKDVAYYEQRVAEEEARVAGANAWIRALYESLEAAQVSA